MWELQIDCEKGLSGGVLEARGLVKKMVRMIANRRELDR